MNRNTESHFALNPDIDISRSRFDRSSTHKTTFNTGKLIPILVDEILPGDTYEIDTSAVIRSTPAIAPVMDNAYLDIYYFFVPNRLVWDHWKEFMGENTATKWEQTVEYTVPQLTPPAEGWTQRDVASYMGIPIRIPGVQNADGTWNYSVNALPFRAYGLIWNEWFRDENLQDPILITKGDANTTGTTNSVTPQNAIRGATVLPVNKYHDYFTSALPQPQKGPAVNLPLGTFAPVISTVWPGRPDTSSLEMPMYFKAITGSLQDNKEYTLQINGGESPGLRAIEQTIPSGSTSLVAPATLTADLRSATAATINELRLAFQIQKLYEKDARGGTRYIEIIKSHFGVTSPDARLQRPEYIGGKRIDMNMAQVIQTSETQATPQGNVAGMSHTVFESGTITKSFVEHGILMGLACVRTDHTYQQGLEKLWSRKGRFDYYWPALANIGEQAILNKEIYLQQDSTANEQAFGYQEAWAEYRYKPSRVSGAFRSNAKAPGPGTTSTLDFYHYADYYTSQPYLSTEWIQETDKNVNRTLAVQSQLEDQWLADFYFKVITSRAMPVYSIPGLIDHN